MNQIDTIAALITARYGAATWEAALERLDSMLKGPSETCDFDLIEGIVHRGLTDEDRALRFVDYPTTPELPCSAHTVGTIDRARAHAINPNMRARGLRDTVSAQQQPEHLDDGFGDLAPSPAELFINARLKLETHRLQHLVIAFHPVYGEYDLLTNRRRAVCRNCGPVFGWDAEIGHDAGLSDALVAVAHQYEIFAAMPDHRLRGYSHAHQAERNDP